MHTMEATTAPWCLCLLPSWSSASTLTCRLCHLAGLRPPSSPRPSQGPPDQGDPEHCLQTRSQLQLTANSELLACYHMPHLLFSAVRHALSKKTKEHAKKTIIFPPPWMKCPFKTQTYNIQNRSQNYTCNISFKLFTEGITVAFIKIFSCFFPNEIHVLSSSSLFWHCFQKFTVFQVP